MMDKNWYVIEAEEGKAFKAQLEMAVCGLTVWLPVIVKRSLSRARSHKPRKDIRIPRFGRYLFVQCDLSDSVWHAIRNSRFVRRMLSASIDGRPSPVPHEAIDWLREETPLEAPPIIHVPYSKGDLVRIIEGPFSGQLGPIQGLDSSGIVVVTLELLGRAAPLPVPIAYVESASPHGSEQAKPRRRSEAVAA